MREKLRVLVTGHHGYVGSVMAPCLAEAGHDVVGLDVDYFDDCLLVQDTVDLPSIRKDLRDLTEDDLRGFDAVVHLAALSNDPIGNLNAAWTRDINLGGSRRLAQLARSAGVRRFLFSSSCIMYGVTQAGLVDENSPLNPQTEYARSKVEAERAISELATDNFSPAFLRNGTIYGFSPRMRFDTVLNNLVGSAVATGKVTLVSDGTPWRPVVDVRDVSGAFLAVLEAPTEKIHDQAFNVGADGLNHQIRELGEIVARTVRGATLEILARPDADQRTYRTDFAKFARTFPDFRFEWMAAQGAADLYRTLADIGLSHEAFAGDRFTRLKHLRRLLAQGRLDDDLRWRDAAS